MKYKLLGKSGLRVSELALGTMTFGEDWGWGASKEDSRAMFDAFANAGGNFIDTSSNYTNGTAEKFVGEFVAGARDQFVIATKYTLRRPGADKHDLNAGGNHRKNMRITVEQSLKRLNTDYIDVLYLHMWDYTTPVEEILRTLDDLIASGKILYAGISDTPAWVTAHAQAIADMRGWNRFVAYQAEYSLLERGVENEVLPMTRAFDMSVLAFSMLAGGVLTGKFNQATAPDEHTRVQEPGAREKAVAEVVVQIAREINHSPSQVAINWVRQQAPNIIPILGTRRPKQMHDNLGVLDFTLHHNELHRLANATKQTASYPQSFWNEYVRRNLIFGERVNDLEMRVGTPPSNP